MRQNNNDEKGKTKVSNSPNSRTFIAGYQRVTHAHLPANVHLARPCKDRGVPKGRRQKQQQVVQQGHGIGSKLLKLVKKVAKASITRKIGKMALNEFPNLYEKGTSKIKNKKNKKLLQSDLANSLLDICTEYGRQELG